MVIETEIPISQGQTRSQAERIIDLAGQILRETYTQDTFPPSFDRPEKPEFLDHFIEVCGQACKNYYREQVFLLTPENVHWVSNEEFQAVWDERPSKKSFNMKLLNTLGGKSIVEEPLSKDIAYLRDDSSCTPQIFISAAQIPFIESADLRNKTFDEFRLAYRLIAYNIFYSRVPREFNHEMLDEELERNLDRDRKLFLRNYQDLEEAGFNIAVDNLKYFIRNDETERTELDGAEVKAYCKIKQDDEECEENFAITGDEFEQDLTEYLAVKPLAEFCKKWISVYPTNLRDSIAKRFVNLLAPTKQQAIAFRQIEFFLRSIGLSGYKDTYKAHLNSEIPIKFIEAKKKNKQLVYPA